MSDYGAKASQDLIVTRGAGFRKEKNKKRGSWLSRLFKRSSKTPRGSESGNDEASTSR